MDRNEAIKVIKDNWPEDRVLLKLALEFLIPELKESDDERIRKSIIDLVEKQMPKSENKKWMISWLEKQSEKTDIIENFDTEFEKQVSRFIASAINKEHEYNQSYIKWAANALLNYAKHELEKQDEHKCDCKYVGCRVNNMKRWCHKKQSEILYEKCNIKCSEYLKQGEQKPTAWTDKDWSYYNKLETFLEAQNHYSPSKSSSGFQKVVHETLIWLKSLRPNKYVTWSEEDEEIIEGLNNCLDELEEKNGWRFTYVNDKDIELSKIRNWLKSIRPQQKTRVE